MEGETQHQSVEPTTPATPRFINPYEPYTDTPTTQDYIGIPPPPIKKRRGSLMPLWICLAIAILLVFASGLFVMARSFQVSKSQPTPIVRFVPVTATPTRAPTAIVNPNYTASDIMADFLHAGLPIENTVYNNTIWDL